MLTSRSNRIAIWKVKKRKKGKSKDELLHFISYLHYCTTVHHFRQFIILVLVQFENLSSTANNNNNFIFLFGNLLSDDSYGSDWDINERGFFFRWNMKIWNRFPNNLICAITSHIKLKRNTRKNEERKTKHGINS